jgi:alanyl-tRNA synthetase
MDALMLETKNSGNSVINGTAVFELYDTFGFPVDLTALIARENNFRLMKLVFKLN